MEESPAPSTSSTLFLAYPSAPSADPEANDLFFLELKYHDPYANLDVPAISRKSGDISQVWWRARGRNREGYGLTYDYLWRMTKAQHVRLGDGNSPTTPGARIINNYSEQLEYADQRGNIARILRYGMNYTSSTQAGSGVIDDLQFITEPGRNRIQRINEQASDLVFKLKGFRPKTEANGSTSTGGIDYSYDANGNQTSDPHKGITSIQYNYLNLPSLITYTDGRKIEQRYDAAGNLASRLMTGDASTPANNYFQVYVHGTEYRGSTIESVAHQEGRLFRSGGSNSSPVWRYEYSISDHLGNTRLTFADKTPDGVIKVEDGEVLEEAHYYPFGLAMEGPWMNDAAALDNRYKFNGIERVQDFGLNVDMAMYRAYDPAIGRWWQIDPMAAMAPEQTPYRFGFNNPMNFVDPFGLFETRREAREYKEENDVEGKVKKQKDGTFAVVNKKSGGFVTKDKQYGITFGVTGKRPKDNNPAFNEFEHPGPVPDWLNGIYTSGPGETPGTHVWYDKNHNAVPYDPPANGAHLFGRMFDAFGMVSGTSKVVGTIVGAIKKSRIWEVGEYKKLVGVEHGLQAHHVGQKAEMAKFIPTYDLSTAPSILVPTVGHTRRGAFGIVARTGTFQNARQLLARDIFELRRVYPGIPNHALERLIEMNKKMYPGAFKK